MSSACGFRNAPTGCMNPCDDVFLCVNVERAQSENGELDEFLYTVTIQNCSKSTLRGGEVYVKLGGFICNMNSANAISQAVGQLGSTTGRDWENCSNGSFSPNSWTGDSNLSIMDDTNKIFDGLYIPPGSWQGWFRFTSHRSAGAGSSRLSSTVVFKANVIDSTCQAPCRIEKCVEVDGDACLGQ